MTTPIQLLCAAALLFTATESTAAREPLYKKADAPIEQRIDDLMGRMTLDEKIWQLNQYTLGFNDNANNIGESVSKVPAQIGSLIYMGVNPTLRNAMQRHAVEESRLGIPVLFGYDAIHGFRTVYPISLAQACSWNTALVEQACAVSAQETRAAGIEWTFSPMIDVARDGRWGRVAEGYGEDPYTNAVFCVASVRGYQGDDLTDAKRVAACLKHYVGYGASEAGRDYVPTEISRQTLWDTYMLPYEEGVKAGAASLMSAFNDISGTPASACHYTMTEVLRDRWKHDGLIVSDWDAVRQLVNQGAAANDKEAAQRAIMAGVDLDMTDNCYRNHLEALIAEGKVPMARVDDAVRRVLRLKFRLGLFENPYTPEVPDAERFLLPASLAVAEQLAAESYVLLKNEASVLPLASGVRLAVIGPMVKDKKHLLGSWWGRGQEQDVTGIWEGLTAEFGEDRLTYAAGCDFEGDDRSGFAAAVEAARGADVVVLCLGEKRNWSGENASRSTLALPAIQEALAAEIRNVGKPVVLVLSNGRPLELTRLEPLSDAILEIWQPGIAGGRPLAAMLAGKLNPSGKLAMTFPYSTGQIPIYYNHRRSGRTHQQGRYQDIPSTPLYEFGYGLSYSHFTYGDARIVSHEPLTIEVAVTNDSARDGLETVHWYVSDPVSTITRPVKELKFFEKRPIPAGKTETFRFVIDPVRDLGFVDADGRRFVEAGDYVVMVGDKQVKFDYNK